MTSIIAAADGVQASVANTLLGAALGTAIEALVPPFSSDVPVSTQLFETVLQAGLSGAALAVVGSYQSVADPTFGIPFCMALYQTQPEMSKRLVALTAAVKLMGRGHVLKMQGLPTAPDRVAED